MAERWPGLISDADPHDLPDGGGVVQENLMSLQPGKLSGRAGMRPAMYMNSGSGSAETGDILCVATFSSPVGETIMLLSDNGVVSYGRQPQ